MGRTLVLKNSHIKMFAGDRHKYEGALVQEILNWWLFKVELLNYGNIEFSYFPGTQMTVLLRCSIAML